MTLYRQDLLALADLETQLAAAIRAQNTRSQLIEIDKTLFYAQSVSEIRAKRLTALSASYPDGGSGSGATPTPTSGDTMPATNPNGNYALTGKVVRVDFDMNAPRDPVAGWNAVYSDLQQQDTATFTDANGQATSIYKMARIGNRSDANLYGEIANPANSGILPDIIMATNHAIVPGYAIDDRIGGLTPGYAYDLAFYGSRKADAEFTRFTVGADSLVLDVSHNTTRGVTFMKVRPSPLGIIYWSWAAAPNTDTDAGAMAALIITEFAPA